ncbi:phage portal protein [Sulfitobacter sp. 1A16787]|uniref:phage portal protein n=1 Tax=Sulfitobacter sp. 1A16787 TaxID=3368571 RepID=UPI003745FBD1
MGIFNRKGKGKRPEDTTAAAPAVDPVAVEAREMPRIGSMPQSSPHIMEFLGMGTPGVTGEAVTIDTALRVPAIWAAVNFYANAMAALPIKVFQKNKDGTRAEASDHPAAWVLNKGANDELSAFDWRQSGFTEYTTAGRHVSFLEYNGRGELVAAWPLEHDNLTVRRMGGKLRYSYGARGQTYRADEVIDLVMMPRGNGLSARSPVYSNADTIGLALAVTRYGARFFDNGGVPPFTVSGPIRTAGGVARASEDLTQAVVDASNEGRNALALPEGHTLTPLGLDPEKMQMVEVKRFLVEEFARIWNIPPVFLHDLTHGTFSNTEQQDLHFIKHCLAPLVRKYEQQVNLKLFGRASDLYAECNLDALARGVLKDRAEARARQIMTGQLTPNEARAQDNRPGLPGGDDLLMQSATVALANPAPQAPAGGQSNPKGKDDE